MFDTSNISDLKGVVGWKEHFDPTDITVPVARQASSSGRYFQEFHPAMRLDKVKACLPSQMSLDTYLDEVEDQGVKRVLSMIRTHRLDNQTAKNVLVEDDLFFKWGNKISNEITNTGAFVGYCIEMRPDIGIMSVLKGIAMHINADVTDLTIYIYKQGKEAPVATFDQSFTALDASFKKIEQKLYSDGDISGGEYYIGYYQDDLGTTAINYDEFDWVKGPCGGCDGGKSLSKWKNLNRHLQGISSFYVSSPPAQGELWDKQDMEFVNNRTWGLNFRISVECNLNAFVARHKHLLDEAIGLAVTQSILNEIKFSNQRNFVEEDLKMMSARDLEGDKESNMLNIDQRLHKAIKNIGFDFGNLSAPCLACSKNGPGIKILQA